MHSIFDPCLDFGIVHINSNLHIDSLELANAKDFSKTFSDLLQKVENNLQHATKDIRTANP